MPDDYRQFGQAWAGLNPGRTVRDWSEDDILARTWRNQAVIEHLYERDEERRSVELYVQLADVVSYELLWQFGGTYINCDIEPLRPLAELEAEYGRTWVVHEDPDFVVNAAMGGVPEDPFWDAVIDFLPRRYFAEPTAEMVFTTGPRMLTEVWRSRPVPALPWQAFNSTHWSTIPLGGTAAGRDIPEGAYGLHHWGHRRDQRTNRIERA